MTRVFISYVKNNLKEVQKLVKILQIYDIDVWIDYQRLKPGHKWKDVIRKGISEGDFFIACFSTEYLSRTKSYMNEELILAIEELRLRPADRAWFIPVLLSDCDIPDRDIGGGLTLRSIQWVSLHDNWNEGIQLILSVIQPDSSELFKLLTLLKSDSARVRIRASDDLGNLGRLAEKAIPTLLETLNDKNETVRASAANALGNIGINDERVIAALVSNLKNDRDSIYPRQHAVKALTKLGVPGIIAAILALPYMKYREHYLWKQLADLGESDIPKLIDLVANRSEHFDVAGLALRHIRIKDINVYKELIKGLKHHDSQVRYHCLSACRTSYLEVSELIPFIPDLIELLEDDNTEISDIHLHAIDTLGRIGKAANKAVPALIRKLNPLNFSFHRHHVISALGDIGDSAAIPVLTELLNDTDKYVPYDAINALNKIGTTEALEIVKNHTSRK